VRLRGPARRGALTAAVAAIVVVVVLVISGLRSGPVRSFALRVPSASPVATVRAKRPVCEGPVTASGQTSLVGVFGAPKRGLSRLHVTVRDAGTGDHGRVLATGAAVTAEVMTEDLVALDRTVPAGHSLRVCVRATTNPFVLEGAPASAVGVRMTGHRRAQFSLVLDHRASFIGSLSTAFSRAAVFRPAWVGSWTFWVLTAAFAATFGLAIVAVAQAADADEE
jgi:hypothetical protein